MLMEQDVKESLKMVVLTDKVRRETLFMVYYWFIFSLSKLFFTFEAKYFDAGGVRYEGEYQGKKGGQ